MASMIQHEQGSQPYSEDQLSNAIQSAIMDDRWSGLRSPERLTQQRGISFLVQEVEEVTFHTVSWRRRRKC
jgi:hypothetical protein